MLSIMRYDRYINMGSFNMFDFVIESFIYICSFIENYLLPFHFKRTLFVLFYFHIRGKTFKKKTLLKRYWTTVTATITLKR